MGEAKLRRDSLVQRGTTVVRGHRRGRMTEESLRDEARALNGGDLGGMVERAVDLRGVNSQANVYVTTPDDLLVKMARMQRDGYSIDRIRVEVNVPRWSRVPNGSVPSDEVFQRAIDRGHALLTGRIERGEEPAESVVRVMVPEELLQDDGEELEVVEVEGPVAHRPILLPDGRPARPS